MSVLDVAKSEFILGGQGSGKSRRAEMLARSWLDQSDTHRAVLIATAQPWDDAMRLLIARHRADRALRVPGMATVEEPLALAEAIAGHSHPHTLVGVDCLTLWLANALMPAESGVLKENEPLAPEEYGHTASLLIAIQDSLGPVVLVGNEIGLGLIPMGRAVRAFVDALGRLNQDVASVCQRVTLMAAGLPLHLKDCA